MSQSPVISVLFGGISPEHDVSILTGLQASRALANVGRSVQAIYWTTSGTFYIVPPTLEASAFLDAATGRAGVPQGAEMIRLVSSVGFIKAKQGVFGKEKPLDVGVIINCCHGGPGEDGSLQAILDSAEIFYTGPNVASAALAMDKLAFTGVVLTAGLPSLPRVAVNTAPDWHPGFDGPYIVKPRFGGSSIGIHVCDDAETARQLTATQVHLRRGAIIEPYRPNSVDVNISIRCHPTLQLSAIEKPTRSGAGEILNYTDKYVGGEGMASAPRELPAKIDESIAKQLREYAAVIADIAMIRGVARVDFLLEDDKLFVNEVNNPPGSLSRYLWIDPAIPFEQLLLDMVDEAIAKPASITSSAGADGLILRGASAIAAKLA